jgi:hypothetical protein
MVQRAIETFGRIDILVINAGNAVLTPLLETTAAAWDRMLKIHLIGTFFIEGLWIYHSQFPSSGCLQMSGDRYRGVRGDLRRVLDHHDFGASFQ